MVEFRQITEHMDIVGADGVHIGTVDKVEGHRIKMTKADIIRLGVTLKVPFHLTHSCYDPIGALACGQCDSCLIRRRGFCEAGVVDPVPYAVL